MSFAADSTLLVFAYGSNLSTARLVARTPSARFVTRATLSAHALAWHKRGMDGTAKCDALFTGRREDAVQGVVWRIASAEKPRLDAAEGLGAGYDEKRVEVLGGERLLVAWMYFATRIDPSLRPFDWYRDHVLAGAREHGLPEVYTRAIEAVRCVPDPDARRAAEQRGLRSAPGGDR